MGTQNVPSQKLIDFLQKYVCYLYGEKHLKSIDEARKRIFWRNFERDEKVPNLSLLLHVAAVAARSPRKLRYKNLATNKIPNNRY